MLENDGNLYQPLLAVVVAVCVQARYPSLLACDKPLQFRHAVIMSLHRIREDFVKKQHLGMHWSHSEFGHLLCA